MQRAGQIVAEQHICKSNARDGGKYFAPRGQRASEYADQQQTADGNVQAFWKADTHFQVVKIHPHVRCGNDEERYHDQPQQFQRGLAGSGEMIQGEQTPHQPHMDDLILHIGLKQKLGDRHLIENERPGDERQNKICRCCHVASRARGSGRAAEPAR